MVCMEAVWRILSSPLSEFAFSQPKTKESYYRIGSSIRRNRQEKGLTQEELAEAAGLSLKMVQKMEGGQK